VSVGHVSSTKLSLVLYAPMALIKVFARARISSGELHCRLFPPASETLSRVHWSFVFGFDIVRFFCRRPARAGLSISTMHAGHTTTTAGRLGTDAGHCPRGCLGVTASRHFDWRRGPVALKWSCEHVTRWGKGGGQWYTSKTACALEAVGRRLGPCCLLSAT